MSISQAIADLAGQLDATRTKLAAVNATIEALEGERASIAGAPPHTEDIAGVFLRGLNIASADFTRQMTTHLSESYVGNGSAVAAAPQRAASILTLEAKKLDREEVMTRSIRGDTPDLNISALAYFMRDQIATEIPALVDKLLPAARQGMKQAERDRALSDVDAKLAALSSERDQLQADLVAARAAVR